MVKSRNVIATPPGATIKEQLVERGMLQKEFALRMGMSEKHISRLINGEVQLTPDMALRLETVLGVPSKFWCNLEAIYREKLVKIHVENEMDADMILLKKFPYDEMAKLGWLPEAERPQDRVMNLRKFFEVVNLSLMEHSLLFPANCWQLSESDKADYSLIAWTQKSRLEARKILTQPVDLKKLSADLPQLRSMTVEPPSQFCPKLVKTLASCGIALIFLPQMGCPPLYSTAFYDGVKIVISLTIGDESTDDLWFRLFHELGHILQGHINQPDSVPEDAEHSADLFAQTHLIPQQDFTCFISDGNFSKKAVIEFAGRLHIAPGIAVGCLQREGLIPSSQYNDLKSNDSL